MGITADALLAFLGSILLLVPVQIYAGRFPKRKQLYKLHSYN